MRLKGRCSRSLLKVIERHLVYISEPIFGIGPSHPPRASNTIQIKPLQHQSPICQFLTLKFYRILFFFFLFHSLLSLRRPTRTRNSKGQSLSCATFSFFFCHSSRILSLSEENPLNQWRGKKKKQLYGNSSAIAAVQ